MVCFSVDDLCREGVLGLLLAVQPLHGVDVACHLVDGEDRARPLACEDVLDALATDIQIRVELETTGRGGV